MFREIRRKNREINIDSAKQLLQSSRRGVLAVNGDDGYPYAIPINYLYDDEAQRIYFHGAKIGHKVDALRASDIFTTHNTELLSMELLRKDQLYFVDKHIDDGASELYSISTFSTRTTDNIRKGYLLGKYGAIPDIEIERLRD